MSVQIQMKRGQLGSWEEQNPTLADGEIGFARDLNRIKIGDGQASWNKLDYLKTSDVYIGDNAPEDEAIQLWIKPAEDKVILYIRNKDGKFNNGVDTIALRGESAYDIAINKGFEGTQEEWLNSLKGQTGESAFELYKKAYDKGDDFTVQQFFDELRGPAGPEGIVNLDSLLNALNNLTEQQKSSIREKIGSASTPHAYIINGKLIIK